MHPFFLAFLWQDLSYFLLYIEVKQEVFLTAYLLQKLQRGYLGCYQRKTLGDLSEKQKGDKMNYMNPYQFPQQNYMNQKIQNLSSIITSDAQVFYANNPQDMERITPQANVLYIGINTTNKEIYLRQMNGMGLIDIDTYVRKSGEQQKNDLTKILEKLDELMKGKGNVQSANDTVRNEYANKGNVAESPSNATV